MTSINWNFIEVKESSFNTSVYNYLKNFERDEKAECVSAGENAVRTATEELYLRIRPKLVECGIVSDNNCGTDKKDDKKNGKKDSTKDGKKDSKKDSIKDGKKDSKKDSTKDGKKQKPIPKKKAQSKKTEIMQKNALCTLEEAVNELLATFDADQLVYSYGINRDILELRIITLIHIVNSVCSASSLTIDDAYESILIVKRFVSCCTGQKFKSMVDPRSSALVSQTALDDLEYTLGKLLRKVPFNGLNLLKHSPKLVFVTEYDRVLPVSTIAPRADQIQLMNLIRSSYKTSFSIMYKALIGSGKTTMAATWIPTSISKINKANPADKVELIYCCSLEYVRNQVAKIAYNAGIKFGLSFMKKTGEYIVYNHWSCKNDKERTLIIADLAGALNLIRSNPQNWLFYDEPSIDLGSELSTNILKNLPSQTILASATMPHINFTDRKFVDIVSNELWIGCNLYTHDGLPIMPHTGISTGSDLLKMKQLVMKEPFFKKLYTVDALVSLHEKMIQAGINDLPNVDEIFSDVKNVNYKSVRNCCMHLLDILTKENDSVVARVCGAAEANSSNAIDFHLLPTTQAHRFTNMSLVVAHDPVEWTKSEFGEYLDILQDFKFEKQWADFKKSEKSASDTISKLSEQKTMSGLKMNQDDRSRYIYNMSVRNSVAFDFPEEYQINTEAHAKKFAKIKLDEHRPSLELENINFDSLSVSTDIKLLLCAGIGIYSSQLSNQYNTIVMNLAAEGRLAYLISDYSICFGINYPINRVFVTKQFGDENSISTIMQVLGRAGRVGQSWRAEGYIDKFIAQRICSTDAFCEMKKKEADEINMLLGYKK